MEVAFTIPFARALQEYSPLNSRIEDCDEHGLEYSVQKEEEEEKKLHNVREHMSIHHGQPKLAGVAYGTRCRLIAWRGSLLQPLNNSLPVYYEVAKFDY